MSFRPGHGKHAHLAAHVEQQLDEAFAVGDEGVRVDHLQHFLARGPADVHDLVCLQAQVLHVYIALDEVEVVKAAGKVDGQRRTHALDGGIKAQFLLRFRMAACRLVSPASAQPPALKSHLPGQAAFVFCRRWISMRPRASKTQTWTTRCNPPSGKPPKRSATCPVGRRSSSYMSRYSMIGSDPLEREAVVEHAAGVRPAVRTRGAAFEDDGDQFHAVAFSGADEAVAAARYSPSCRRRRRDSSIPNRRRR